MIKVRKFSSKLNKPLKEINVIPYVDVSFVLIVIFLITTPEIQTAVEVSLPRVPVINSKSKTLIEIPFVITVTSDGLYKTSLNPNQFIGEQEFEELIANSIAQSVVNPNKTIYIQGDSRAPYGKVINLFVTLRINGVKNVSLLTMPK